MLHNQLIVNKQAGKTILDEISKFRGSIASEFASNVNLNKFKNPTSPTLAKAGKRRNSYRSTIMLKSMENIYCETSLYFFNKYSKLRMICYKIVKSSYFENFMNFIIILSSLMIVWETYLNYDYPNDFEMIFINIFIYLNGVLTFIYVCEISIKSIVYGFILDKKSFMRNGWNVLDFLLCVSYISDSLTPDEMDNMFIQVFYNFVNHLIYF